MEALNLNDRDTDVPVIDTKKCRIKIHFQLFSVPESDYCANAILRLYRLFGVKITYVSSECHTCVCVGAQELVSKCFSFDILRQRQPSMMSSFVSYLS